MKNIFLYAAILLCPVIAWNQVDNNAYGVFIKDSIYYTLGDHVNVRLNPDKEGKIIYTLPIGEKIRIVDNSGIGYTQNGYTCNWYRIVFNNKGTKAEGYIWGGFIATQTVTASSDKSLLFMYGPSKITRQEYYDELNIQVRVCRNKVQLAKLEIIAVGNINTYNKAMSMGNKGVEGVKDIFKINFSDGFCAGAFGDAYFFWNGEQLFHVETLHEGFDAPYYSTNEFIFPADENGSKKGYIINKRESGYYGDDDKNHIEEWEKTTYQWSGSQLMVIKTGKNK